MNAPKNRPIRDNPWWIPPFLGAIPAGVNPREVRLLGFVAFAMFFENYDLSILGNALPQIRQTFSIDERQAAEFTGLIRLGAIPAFFLIPLADRIGRRSLLLASIVGVSFGSLLSAVSPSAAWFVAMQVLTRTCIIAASVTAFVIIAEEFPAERRGWGIGILGSVGAFGFGVGAGVYAFVESLPFGWRSLYVLGFAPVLALPLFKRGIPETRRFQEQVNRDDDTSSGWRRIVSMMGPMLELARSHPRRAIAIATLGAVATAGLAPPFQFVSDFLQGDRGWSPGTFAGMTIFFGGMGVIGSVVAGRLGDRYGRRLIGAAVLVPFPIFAWGFYMGPSNLLVIPWVLMVFSSMAVTVIVRALAAEVFPTSTRGTAGGGLALFETLGAAIGLFLLSVGLTAFPESRSAVIATISSLVSVSAVALLFLPETRSRELEEISGEEPESITQE